jgi:NCAIR mutase (PurE)-related protein
MILKEILQTLSNLTEAKHNNTLSDSRFITEVTRHLSALATIGKQGVMMFTEMQMKSMDYFQRTLVERVADRAYTLGAAAGAAGVIAAGTEDLAKLIETEAQKLLQDMGDLSATYSKPKETEGT